MSNEPQTREWLSPNDLASWLNLPVQTIYQWRYRGGGPPGHAVGRHVRYRLADVEAWLAERADPQPAA
jgi:excisionase family DNA binding protein